MYPAQFFSLFPPFPRDDNVFVAMSFDRRFDARWENVIAKAVGRVVRKRDGVDLGKLQPYRTDTSSLSDSILTDILDRMRASLLVFADITTIGQLDGKPIRSGNVMYEVGLAQAVRLPEEVILFRSDDDALPFDTSHIRVRTYAPDTDPDGARETLADAVVEALRAIDLSRHLAVQRAAEAMDPDGFWLLARVVGGALVHYPSVKTFGDIVSKTPLANAIERLLDIGAIRTKYLALTPEWLEEHGHETSRFEHLMPYEATPFGSAILNEMTARMKLFDDKVAAIIKSKGSPTPKETA